MRLMVLGFLLVCIGVVGGCSQSKSVRPPAPSIHVKTSALEQVCKPESQTRNIANLADGSTYIVVCLDGRVKEVDLTP
jgi:hypothetical protein